MRHFLFSIFIVSLTFPSISYALSCFPDRSPTGIEMYDVIVDAVPEKIGNHEKQKFKVENVYKGRVKKDSFITVNQPNNMVSKPSYFELDKNYILFLKVELQLNEYRYDPCSPSFSKEEAVGTDYNREYASETFAYLESRNAKSFNDKIMSYHKLTVQYPHVIYFHDKIANFLMEQKRFDKAVLAYQNAFRARHMLVVHSKKRVELYVKEYGATYEEIPFYESSLGLPMNTDWFMIGDRKNFVFPYAVALSKAGRKQDALTVLGVLNGLISPDQIEDMREKVRNAS